MAFTLIKANFLIKAGVGATGFQINQVLTRFREQWIVIKIMFLLGCFFMIYRFYFMCVSGLLHVLCALCICLGPTQTGRGRWVPYHHVGTRTKSVPPARAASALSYPLSRLFSLTFCLLFLFIDVFILIFSCYLTRTSLFSFPIMKSSLF